MVVDRGRLIGRFGAVLRGLALVAGLASSFGMRIGLQAATARVKVASTLGLPQTLTDATPAAVLIQPKISSMRLRQPWLMA